tara:strand:- start:215 stop:385 length:171 start_codon:yes stop_codon:yes gene_type:complete
MCGPGIELFDLEEECSICEKTFSGFGNNAQPINDGVCCDDCNKLVIIERLKELKND